MPVIGPLRSLPVLTALMTVTSFTASAQTAPPSAQTAPPSDSEPQAPAERDSDPQAPAERPRPDILVVLLDDVGFMDLGAYGSDTATPRIDRLGEAGTMFTRYYTLPLCGPSRASLLTGQDNHSVGAGTLNEAITDEMRSLPAYSMLWKDDQKTIASRLRESGYQTFVTGKWGVGKKGKNLPHRFGFDRSWVLDATGSSNYAARPYVPLYKEVHWYEDGDEVELPTDFYSSRNIVDKMIEYVDEADPDRPFFGYLSFQALHIPVQAPREFIDKYDGVFDRGWDAAREERLKRAIELGLVPEGTRLAAAPYNRRNWDDLSEKEKKYWARTMQVSAGMMEAADFHLGRLLDHLEKKGRLQNTIVVIASDNGPEYNTLGKTSKGTTLMVEKLFMALEGWNVDYDNLGQPGSLAAIGHEWASVSAAPLHLFKFSASEGGVRVPMVIAGPGIENRGFTSSRCQVADLTPTLLDLAGVGFDPDEFHGRSLVPVLSGQADEVYGEKDSFAIEVSGTAALYRGNWKITKTPQPYGDGKWRLYDVAMDPGETEDVSSKHPDVFREMQDAFRVYAEDVGVYDIPPGENAREQIVKNSISAMASNYAWLLVFVVAVLLAALIGVSFAVRRVLKVRAA